MAATRPRNWVALLLSVVTGLGHFYLDRYITGAVLFGLFVTTANGVFLGFTLQATSSPEVLRVVSTFGLAAVWTFGMWHAYRLSFGTDRVALARAKDQLLREGLIDYLRDDLEDAARKLERAVALDVDWVDPDPLFHLGVASSRLAARRAERGDAVGARRARRRALAAFKGCLARDPARKWRAEVEQELQLMGRGSLTGRMRKVGGSLRDLVSSASGLFRAAPSAPQGGSAPSSPLPEHVRQAITQTRKKRRFSAKYPAIPPQEAGARTHADLRLAAPSAPSGDGETRPDLGTRASAEPAPASTTEEAPAPDEEPSPVERGGVRRFERQTISQRLSAEAVRQAEDPPPPGGEAGAAS
ncbi:MAG: hypothetical protein M9894_01030 [Planctomycetes bacterium]|nr:hypothetical protein [Planctomycetota bacterium]